MTHGLPARMRGGVRRPASVRSGAAADWLRVSWLIETSWRVYTHWGSESLRDLLASPGGLVWLQGRALRGAFVAGMRRAAVAEARLVAVHDDADLAQFAEEVSPAAERRLSACGSRWLSVSSPEDWLRELLIPRGYTLQDRVITYTRQGTALATRGNPTVAVRPALPEHVAGMAAVDAAAFEPFWRLDRAAVRRTLDEDSYVLVARDAGEVGYLTADVWEERAHIVRLGVTPEYQGRGVATRLIAEALRLMGEAGVREVTLNTQETNARSRALYETLGFMVTGAPEEVWVKPLEPAPGED